MPTDREVICNVKLYDADDGIFAGFCGLLKGHKKPHRIIYDVDEQLAEERRIREAENGK